MVPKPCTAFTLVADTRYATASMITKQAGGKHGEIVSVFRAEHGLGHGYANLVAHEALGSSAAHSDAEVKAWLKQAYEGA